MRLDQFLVEQAYFESRNKAQIAIKNGWVQVGPDVITTVAYEIDPEKKLPVQLLNQHPYVSRGGEKLAHALTTFEMDVTGLTCVDVGSSTGGFTDCLLQHGAQKIYAIDVGTDQLHSSLRNDKRVVVFEKTHVKQLPELLLAPPPNLAVVDLSFISVLKALRPISAVLDKTDFSQLVLLVKPQFEQELVREPHQFEDVIRDEKVRQKIVETIAWRIEMFYPSFQVKQVCQSPVVGGDGNIEYLMRLVRFS